MLQDTLPEAPPVLAPPPAPVDTSAALLAAEEAYDADPSPERAAVLRSAREAHELTLSRARVLARRQEAERATRAAEDAKRRAAEEAARAADRAEQAALLDSMRQRLSRRAYLDSIAPHVEIMAEVVGVCRSAIDSMAEAATEHAALYQRARELAGKLGLPLDVGELSEVEARRVARLACFSAIVTAHPLERRPGDWPSGMATESYKPRRDLGTWLDAPVDGAGLYAFARWIKHGVSQDPYPLVSLAEKLRAMLEDPDDATLLRTQHASRAKRDLANLRPIECPVVRGKSAESLNPHVLSCLSEAERAEIACWIAEGRAEHEAREKAWIEAEDVGYGKGGPHGAPVVVPTGGGEGARESAARLWWTFFHESRGLKVPGEGVFRSFMSERKTRSGQHRSRAA